MSHFYATTCKKRRKTTLEILLKELKYKKQQYRDEKLYESIKKNNEKIIYFTYEKYFKNKINIKKNEWYRDKQLFNNVSSIINYLENIIM